MSSLITPTPPTPSRARGIPEGAPKATLVDLRPVGVRPSFSDAFAAVFGELSRLVRAFSDDGILAVAVWEGRRVDAYVHVALDGAPAFATIGRHPRCDLVLAREPAAALRHAVLVARVESGEPRVRLMDLHSESALEIEDGRSCQAVRADGALLVRIGGYQLFMLPTGKLAPLPWGATAEDTWAAIPERVYRDERLPARSHRGRIAPVRAGRRTIVTEILDPPTDLRAARSIATAAPAGRVEVRTARGRETYDVSEDDLARGLLVGRYDRCQIGADDGALSRVHLLVLREGRDVWAVDTASSNGTDLAGAAVHAVPLGKRAELTLARRIAVSWDAAVGRNDP